MERHTANSPLPSELRDIYAQFLGIGAKRRAILSELVRILLRPRRNSPHRDIHPLPIPAPPPTMAPCLYSPLAPAALEKRKRRSWARAGASTESFSAEARQALAVGAFSGTTLTVSVDSKNSAWPVS